MRRLTLATALVGSLFALSCTSDSQAPAEPSTEPSFNGSEINRICSPTPADPIQAQICTIFRPPLELLTATAFYVAIKFEKRVGHTNSAKALGIALVNITLELYNRGKLVPGTTWGQVRSFSCDIFTLVGVPGCGGLPTSPPSASIHSTVQVCTSAGCLVRPADRHSGVLVPSGACPSICTISVNPIPVTFPRRGPLPTSLDQYPLFRRFTLDIPGSVDPTFNSNVLVGICHLSPNDDSPYSPPNATVEGRLQLARDNGDGITIYPRAVAGFLNCDDLLASNEEFFFSPSTLRSSHPGWFASAAQSVYRRAVLPIIRKLLPQPAEATVGACCLGALTNKVSPWAAVDPVGTPDHLGFTVQPSNTNANQPITPAVEVSVQTVGGARVTNATNSITMGLPTNPAEATLSGTLTQSAVNGVATFPDLKINNTGSGFRLGATSSGLSGDVSNPFDIGD